VCTVHAWYDSDKSCLPGTREELLNDIHCWINDVSDPRRALLLTGEAGTGKSAVAHSIARLYDGIDRLGSAYCFDRNEMELTRTNIVIPTIARNLANCELTMKTALSDFLQRKPTIAQTRGIRQQFDELLLAPLRQTNAPGPIVIVIDALDESSPTSRSQLLAAFTDRLSELPPYIRIIITSRPETDIKVALGNHKSVLWKQMGDIAFASTSSDIAQYIHTQLQDLQGSFTDYQATCNSLVIAAGTLFQWAYTACRAIKGSQQRMIPVEKQAKSILSMSKHSAASKDLDEPYRKILSQVFRGDSVPDCYRVVISHILVAIEPLSIQSLEDLLVQSGILVLGEVNMVVGGLGALLSGADKSHHVVRPLHTSLYDFLIDKSRSHEFAIDLSSAQDLSFVWGSLLILNDKLDFNMCKMETSYKLNSDYGDLQAVFIKNTSASTAYAAVNWGKHLERIANMDAVLDNYPNLLDDIQDLLEKKGLFWVEALSLLKGIKASSSALSAVTKCIQTTPIKVCIHKW
jgi:hypothetical protein